MSKYLCFGIAKEVVAKMEDGWHQYSEEEIKKDFFKTVDKSLYDVSVNKEENMICFRLKDEMLAKYGIDLIKEQYEKYIKPENLEEALNYYNQINEKGQDEKIKLINEENCEWLYTFRLGWYGLDAKAFFDLEIDAYITELVSYHTSEKTYMEVYCEFLKYTRNLLINSTENPLKTALAVAI